jgi:hypothetical protein
MKLSFKSVKTFVWKYKWILAVLITLFLIYRQLNVYVVERLESKTFPTRQFQPTIKNTSGFDINVEVFAVSYDAAKKVNTMTSIVKQTKVANNTELKVTTYSTSGNVGFAVKLSTTDGSSKSMKAEISVCSEKKVMNKSTCNIFKPNIANYIELKDYNFKVLHEPSDVSITSPSTDAKWLISSAKPYSVLSIGFKFDS